MSLFPSFFFFFFLLVLLLCLESTSYVLSFRMVFFLSNGQKRELPVFFGQKRMYPENNSGRECLEKV